MSPVLYRREPGAVGIGDEARGGQAALAPIAVRNAEAFDVHFAHDARRQRSQLFVEHMDLGIGDGPSDRDKAAAAVLLGRIAIGHVVDFGTPVDVPGRAGRQQRPEPLQQFRRAGFDGDEELAQPRQPLRRLSNVVEQRVELGRKGIQACDLPSFQRAHESGDVTHGILVDEHLRYASK
nr:hypothetical protein [Xanthomonas albilineans]